MPANWPPDIFYQGDTGILCDWGWMSDSFEKQLHYQLQQQRRHCFNRFMWLQSFVCTSLTWKLLSLVRIDFVLKCYGKRLVFFFHSQLLCNLSETRILQSPFNLRLWADLSHSIYLVKCEILDPPLDTLLTFEVRNSILYFLKQGNSTKCQIYRRSFW